METIDLLLQEFVNLLKIVERIIDEEAEIRNDSHLTLYSIAEFKADLTLLFVDVLKDFLTALRREYGKMGSADA